MCDLCLLKVSPIHMIFWWLWVCCCGFASSEWLSFSACIGRGGVPRPDCIGAEGLLRDGLCGGSSKPLQNPCEWLY